MCIIEDISGLQHHLEVKVIKKLINFRKTGEMNLLYTLMLLFFPVCMIAQNEGTITGKVLLEGKGLDSVYIINYSSQATELTDSLGSFRMQARKGDSLCVVHPSIKDSVFTVSQEIVISRNLLISKRHQVNTLEEAVVNYYPRINAVSLGIVQKKADKLTTSERRLRTAGDFKALHLLSLLGGSLQFDPILNKINGRTKRLKKYIEFDKKMESMSVLKENYSQYLKEELSLSDEDVDRLIWYVIEDKNYGFMLKEERKAKIEFYLRNCWSEITNK